MSLNTTVRPLSILRPVEKITNIDAMAIVERMNTLYDIRNFRDVFENKNEYLYSAIDTVLTRKLTSIEEGFMKMSRLDFFKRKFDLKYSLEAILINYLWEDGNKTPYMVQLYDLDSFLWRKLYDIHRALRQKNTLNEKLNNTADNLYQSISTIIRIPCDLDSSVVVWEEAYYDFEQKLTEHLKEYLDHNEKYGARNINGMYRQMFGDIQWLKETFFPFNK
jgi:hypothetical protein